MSKPITIVSFGPGMSVPGGITRVIELIGTHLPANFRSVHVPTFTRFTGDPEVGSAERGSRVGQLLVYVRALLQAVRFSFRPRTIFHVHFAGRGSALRKGLLCVLLRLLRCRYVVHSHVAGTNLFPAWVTGPLRGLMIWGLKGAKRVIVLNQFWSDFYVSLFRIPANRILILPNPAEIPDIIPDRSRTKELNLLFLGRIGERKGAFDLIRAFAQLDEDTRSRSRLTLAGDGDVAFAQALVSELGVADRIHLTGWVGTEEVRSYLENSDVLLLPSRAEGMAMALIEAMSWGLAVVATNVGGASEFLEDRHNSLLVQPGDIRSIANAIATLEANPALRLKLGRAARETIARFAIPGYIAALRALYEELAEPVTPSSERLDRSEEQRPSKAASQHPLDASRSSVR
jgi:glycosyltransferase involved in cell wall biosynthesis